MLGVKIDMAYWSGFNIKKDEQTEAGDINSDNKRITGTLPDNGRISESIVHDERKTGTLPHNERITGTIPDNERVTGTMPHNERVTGTLQYERNTRLFINRQDENPDDESEYIYEIPCGTELQGEQNYTVVQWVSYGGQAEVYKVKTLLGTEYIAKVYRQGKQNKYHDDIVDFLTHNIKRGIIKLIDYGKYRNRYFYIYPCYKKGSLDLLSLNLGEDKDRFEKYIYILNEALNSIHNAGLIHADIKPANILWDEENDIPVITDFGSVTKGNIQTETNRSITLADGKVSEGYLAPDAVAFTALNTDGKTKIEVATKTDYFALGVTLCELYMNANNFRLFRNNMEIALQLKEGKVVYPKKIENDTRFFNLVQAMLAYDPRVRAGYKQVNEWLNGKKLEVVHVVEAANSFKHFFIDRDYTDTYELARAYVVRDWDATIKDVFRDTLYNAFEKYDEKVYSKILDIREDNMGIDERPASAFKIICNIAPELPFFWNGKIYTNKDNFNLALDICNSVEEENNLFSILFTTGAIRTFYEVNDNRNKYLDEIDSIIKIAKDSVEKAQLLYAELISPGILVYKISDGKYTEIKTYFNDFQNELINNGFDNAVLYREKKLTKKNMLIELYENQKKSQEFNTLLLKYGHGNELIETDFKYESNKIFYPIIRLLEAVDALLGEDSNVINAIKKSATYILFSTLVENYNNYEFTGTALNICEKMKKLNDIVDGSGDFFAKHIHFFDDSLEIIKCFNPANSTYIFLQEKDIIDDCLSLPENNYIIPQKKEYKLCQVNDEYYMPLICAQNIQKNGYDIKISVIDLKNHADFKKHINEYNAKKLKKFLKELQDKTYSKKREHIPLIQLVIIGLGIITGTLLVINNWKILMEFIKEVLSWGDEEANPVVYMSLGVLPALIIIVSIMLKLILTFKQLLKNAKKVLEKRKLYYHINLIKIAIQELETDVPELSAHSKDILKSYNDGVSDYLSKYGINVIGKEVIKVNTFSSLVISFALIILYKYVGGL